MNRNQRKDQRIGNCEINKMSLSCFDDKINIENNKSDGLAYWLSELSILKTFLLIPAQESFFVKLQKYFNFPSRQNILFIKQEKTIF